jgi:hypothetical protein
MSGDLTMTGQTTPRATPRRGMALAIALAAIVIVGALIAGVFFASTQQYRVGRNSLQSQRASHAAEVGLSTILSTWTPARTDSVKVGRSRRMNDTLIDGVTVRRQFSRVSPTTFWATASAVQGGGTIEGRASRRLNAIVRIVTPEFKIMGAITARGATNVSGATKISGSDTVPGGWDCPPGGNPGAGLVINDSATNYQPGGVNYSISGSPAVKDSTDLVRKDSTFTHFGGISYDSLAKLANKVKTSSASAFSQIGPRYTDIAQTICDIGHGDNWGDTSLVDPKTACDGYFPIVHLKGATNTYTLNGDGGGQGILLVDGNLAIAGQFQWRGLILVKGYVDVTGNSGGGKAGTKVVGAIAAMNQNGVTNRFAGASSVTFSRCVLNQVSARLSNAAPLKDRGWADISY